MRCLTGQRSLRRPPAVGAAATGPRVRATRASPALVVE